MNYDFYAEFWDEKKLDEFIKKELKKCWENIWKSSTKPKNKRPKEFEEKITEILPSLIYEEFILKNEKTYNFTVLLGVLHQYILEKEDFYNKFLESLKKTYQDRRGKNKDVKPTLPKELVKSFYKIFVHNKKQYNTFIQKQLSLMESLNITLREDEFPNLSHLPSHSFFLSITFTLKKPFISKDDEEFYIHENPVSKEKVFKVPYVRASSWKGNLRWVALKNLIDEISKPNDKNKKRQTACSGRTKIVRIFGNEKENREDVIFKNIFSEEFNHEFKKHIVEKNYVNKDGNGRGRLQFYPTFFNRIGLDVIAPHRRDTRAIRKEGPITFEIVPGNEYDEKGNIKERGTKGTFSLLYVPFDLIGKDENSVKKEVRQDLEIIIKAVHKMLTVYGFSAKKTSGYGVVNTDNSFKFELNDEKIKDLGLQPTSGDHEKFKELLNKLEVKD
ncbi:MAG: RAMP superfamily CRISPR-associated protein [Methanosarcinales archaeon]